MTNQGIYREPGAAGGLPLPRTNLLPLTLVVALLAALALVMPALMLAVTGRGAAGGWRLFRDGGGTMYLILLLGMAAPVAVATFGAFVLRGRRIPAGTLFIAPALTFATALLGAWAGQRMVMRALGGESIDVEQKVRILAEGIAESMSNDIFGGFVVCGVAIVAAAAAASAVASIDAVAASRGAAKPSSSGAIGAGAVGAAWLVAAIVLAVIRVRAAGGLIVLTALPIFVLVPFAALAGKKAAVLRTWHDRDEASRMAGTLIVAAISALLAVLALERAADASFTARALSAISGESVDDSQRARILGAAIEAGHLAPVAYALHAVLGGATFGLALAPAFGNGRNPATASAVVTAILGLALLGGALAITSGRMAVPHAMLVQKPDTMVAVVDLPVVVGTFSNKGTSPGRGTQLVVKKDGTGDGTARTTWCNEPMSFTVYADRAATVAMLRSRLGTPRSTWCPKDLIFVAKREHSKEIDSRLGDLAGYLGTTGYIAATIDQDPSLRASGLHVTSVADDALEINGVRVALSPAPGATLVLPTSASAAGSSIELIQYAFRPTDTIDRVLQTISAVETAYEGRLATWRLERQIDDGVRPPAAAPFFGGVTSSPAAISVNGRLPPEVIQRIVRQNQSRMRLCYENGLRTNPTLRGRVTVKFVIDRTGAVSMAVNAGSELTDRGVVDCVTKVFLNLSFPAPEGGIVTVTYPIDFAPTG